ncbi:hypothetical protein VTO42DRAFT_4799 [Malbranchea cinnamomea]
MSSKTRTLPLLSPSVHEPDPPKSDAMEASPVTSVSMAPHAQSSPITEQAQANNANGAPKSSGSQGATSNQPTGAAAAAQQPKVVQTAFIHKLYSMLQDPNIQHLISWSSSNESFVMSPSSDFSKVLAQYFKHTNISSFVRQLNMYGFHKVSDVFHTGSPDSPMWEFKHGNGNFRKGDVAGLREIKRRASRHTLINRDSFSGHKPNASQTGPAAEALPDGPDVRIHHLEHSLYDVHARLARMEESHTLLSSKCQALTESLLRCHQWTISMSQFIMSLIPDHNNPIHQDAANIQREVTRQLDTIRAFDRTNDLFRQSNVPVISLDAGPPLSPRQVPLDDNRRSSMARLPAPHISLSPRRYGSVGTTNSSSNYHHKVSVVPQQSSAHTLSSGPSPLGPSLARRHTSADIREHGWPTSGTTQFGSTAPTGPLSFPPQMVHDANSSEQHVREVLAQYEMGRPKRQSDFSNHSTPVSASEPPPFSNHDSVLTPTGPKIARAPEASLPGTRRSSMASNVHSLLNPTDTPGRPDDDGPIGEDRKRKRLQ